MADIKLNLGNKIKILRELKGISQEAVAIKMGISQQAYRKIESGATRLTIDRAETIAKELDIELDQLLNFNPANYLYQFTQSGIFNNNHMHPIEKIQELYEKLLSEKDAKIASLEKLLEERK
jgi:transcriptional regulator with XRE-family HTH domain